MINLSVMYWKNFVHSNLRELILNYELICLKHEMNMCIIQHNELPFNTHLIRRICEAIIMFLEK